MSHFKRFHFDSTVSSEYILKYKLKFPIAVSNRFLSGPLIRALSPVNQMPRRRKRRVEPKLAIAKRAFANYAEFCVIRNKSYDLKGWEG